MKKLGEGDSGGGVGGQGAEGLVDGPQSILEM